MDKNMNERSVEAEELANKLLEFVNNYSHDADTFAKTIARGHKTLQQSVMRLMKRTIEEMAKVTPDGRNAATVELAKKITEITDGYSLPLV